MAWFVKGKWRERTFVVWKYNKFLAFIRTVHGFLTLDEAMKHKGPYDHIEEKYDTKEEGYGQRIHL